MRSSSTRRLRLLLPLTFFAMAAISLVPTDSWAQGETTSAILGQVTDSTNAAVPGAAVTVIDHATGLKRSAKTDDAGRFNFPQLKPGSYTVRVEAQGFEPQQADNVISGLGQKQTVNLTLRVEQSRETVEVTSEAPIINPSNANTSTTLNAPALESLPNPGGDMTYPVQFAPGALINTAGSGNDFVGGTNGYGNVEFNGLPALSNGYIVDGLETNDPLTNLNSGLFNQSRARPQLDLGSNRQYAVIFRGPGQVWSVPGQLHHQVGYQPVSWQFVRTVERRTPQRS